MSIKTYSPKDVSLTIGGYLIGGYADGTFITVEQEVDAYTKVVGADGEVSRTKSANKSGSLTLTLKQTSDSNRVLGNFVALDESSDTGIVDVQISDNLDYKIFASEGWVRKQPNFEYSSDLTNREWVLDLANVKYTYPVA